MYRRYYHVLGVEAGGYSYKIVDIQMGLIDKRLKERKMSVELTEKAKTIAGQGYSPVYGARPLKRSLQKLILDPLAHRKFWREKFAGEQKLMISPKRGEITLTKKS